MPSVVPTSVTSSRALPLTMRSRPRSRRCAVQREPFEYAILRVSPRVERGETVNVGVVLFCRTRRFLGVRAELGERQVAALEAMSPGMDLEAVRAHLASIRAIVEGEPSAGPIAALAAPERFRWVTSPSSTVIQP